MKLNMVLHKFETYKKFSKNVQSSKLNLLKIINKIKDNKRK